MDIAQLQEALVAADAAYVEKTGKQPYFAADLKLGQTGQWKAQIWKSMDGDERVINGMGESPVAAIGNLMRKIAAMPDRKESELRDFQKDLGHLIDKGNTYGIKVDYLNPLTETMKRLSENIIEHQKETA